MLLQALSLKEPCTSSDNDIQTCIMLHCVNIGVCQGEYGTFITLSVSLRTASWCLAERSLTEIGLNVGCIVCATTYHVSMIAGSRKFPWYQSRAELTLAHSCGSPAGGVEMCPS